MIAYRNEIMGKAYQCDQCGTVDTGVPRGRCTFELYSEKERRVNGFDELELCEVCAGVFAEYVTAALARTDDETSATDAEPWRIG